MIKKTSLLIFILLINCFFGCSKNKNSFFKDQEFFAVKKVDIKDVISQTGLVDPVIKVNIKSETSGKIDSVYVKEGTRLKKDQTILVIDPTKLNNEKQKLKISIEKKRLYLKKAQRDLNNALALSKKGAVSEKQIQDYKHEVELIKLELKALELDMKDINDQLDKSVIKSPMDGVLISLLVEKGEIVTSATSGFSGGTDIGTVADVSELEVVADIGEVDYPKLSIGQKVLISLESDANTKTLGRINFMSLAAKQESGSEISTFEVRIAIDSLIEGLYPGVNVNVEFTLFEKDNVLGAPYNFVKEKDVDGKKIYNVFVKKKEKIVPQKVKLGKTDYRYYEVLDGLKEGDTLYTPLPEKPFGKKGLKK